ncbi:MAG: hypothetical protein O2877_01410 [bacterium]|nr:hypothetical protein [bacterium]
MSVLTQSGLSEKEAAVYLAACELGPSPATEIARKSDVNRATVYVCLESLEKKGFMGTAEMLGKNVFVAEHPDVILDTLKRDYELLEKRQKNFTNSMPELAAHYNVEGKKPKVLFMEGLEGLRDHQVVFENLRGPYIQITNIDDAANAFKGSEFTRAKHQDRLKKEEVGGRALLVTRQSFDDIELAPLPTDVKFLHFEKYPVHGEVTVREDTIFLFSYKLDTFVTIIRSQTMANTIKAMFELAWEAAERLPGKTAEERMGDGWQKQSKP